MATVVEVGDRRDGPDERPQRPPRLPPSFTPGWAGGIAAVVTFLGGAFALNRFLVGIFYDDGLYAALAVALASGEGYVHLNLPAAPEAVRYPPLYPLVLTPLYATLSVYGAAIAAKVLNLLLATAAAGLVAWHAERTRILGHHVPTGVAAAIVAAAATAIPQLTVQSVLFSEPLFVVLLALAVLLTDQPPSRLAPATAAAIAGGVAACAVLTRSIGVAVGAGIVLFALLIRREPLARGAVVAVPVIVATLAWSVWVFVHRDGIDPALVSSYGAYGDYLRQAGLSDLRTSLRDLPRPLGAITLGWLPNRAVYLFAGTTALALGLYGLVLLIKRSAIGLVLCCYLAVLAIWPFYPDRFLWAVLPWMALAWAAGAADLWRRRALRIPVAALIAMVALGYGLYQVRGFAGRWWHGAARPITANFEELLPAISTLPSDAVIAVDDEPLVWLYTGRRAVPLYVYDYEGRETRAVTPAAHRAFLERQGVSHIVLASASSPAAGELRALIGAYPGWLVPVHQWTGARWIYEVRADR